MAARIRRGRKGPTLETVHMIERVLRGSDGPLTLRQIQLRLPRGVMHISLREAIEHYARLGLVTEGPNGVVWSAVLGPREAGGLDLHGLPTFADEDPKASRRHDKYLYG